MSTFFSLIPSPALLSSVRQDERVFTVNAPGDDVFAFSYVAALRYAVAALAHDAQLERVRFALVPKRYVAAFLTIITH